MSRLDKILARYPGEARQLKEAGLSMYLAPKGKVYMAVSFIAKPGGDKIAPMATVHRESPVRAVREAIARGIDRVNSIKSKVAGEVQNEAS